MNFHVKAFISVIVILLLMSCSNTYESKGDKAYKLAKNAQGDTGRKLKKEAYMYYRQAIKAHPEKVSMNLRNRFIEMTLARAEMVLLDGSYKMDAIPLFIKDIDGVLNTDVDQQLKERYAAFLVAMADSSLKIHKLYQGLNTLDKAIGVAVNKVPIEKKKLDIIDNFAKENYEAAEIEMINGITNQDAESLVRAEFMVQVALLYDKGYPGAKEMLSKLRKENRGTYSAYEAVVYEKPDTNIFDQINKYDILLAVPKVADASRSAYMEVELYNYSCNPQRLRPKNFFIEDTRGRKYTALKSSKMEKEIVDQEHEVKLKLRFKKSGAKIKKLAFQSDDGDSYTEKLFF